MQRCIDSGGNHVERDKSQFGIDLIFHTSIVISLPDPVIGKSQFEFNGSASLVQIKILHITL